MLAKYSKNKPKNEQRTQKKQQNTLRLYRLSSDLASYLEKTLKNGINAAKFISFERMSQLCQSQLRKIAQFKGQDGQNNEQVVDHELTVAVVGIQSKIILEEKRQADFSSSRLSLPDRKRESDDSKDSKLIRRYENLLAEIQKSQSQIRIFLDRETTENDLDFANCYFFFVTHARKLKKISKQKLVASRIKLMQTLIFFLKEAAIHLQPEMAQKIEAEYTQQSIIYGANASFLDSSMSQNHQQTLSYQQVNNWPRYSSRFVQDKMIQLSGICQQIPQLQTYKRTLQFAQLESNQKTCFFKVIDVLISLHHKVSYLARNKPQLLKQLEQGKCQISFMNTRIDQFLGQMMDQTNEIYPINFEGMDQRWKSQLSQDLTHLRGHLHKLSQIIIRQDQIHTQNYAKVDRLIKIVQLFGKVLSGQSEFSEQWDQLVNEQQRKESQSMSNQQYRVIMLLEECLAIEHSRIQAMQHNDNHQVNRTNEELEIEVNKLIEDYERLKGDNSQLANTLEMERRLREELLVEVDERDKIIKNLSAKKLALQKKLAKQDDGSVASSRFKDGQYRKLQHQVQKYLESSLLLKQQLKVSEGEREKLLSQLQTDKQQYLKAFESVNRLKPEKDRLEIQCEELNSRLQILKNEQLRQTNRLNKIITDLTNQKSLLQMQLDTAERNNLRLIQRLDMNDKKIAEYNKLMMARLEEKDDNSTLRLERELDRYKRESENYQQEAKDWQLQNRALRDELANLKFKLKQNELNRQNNSQSDQLVDQMKIKLEKLQNKNNTLSRSLQETKSREEDLQQKLRASNKKIRQLQSKQRELQNDKARFIKNSQQSQRKAQDFQRQLEELRHWNDKQVRNAREMLSKKQIELLQKVTAMSGLQRKIRMLQDQLSQKSNQSDKVTQELIETKVKQYQTTIETHKLIELKLEQKARTLQKELQEKIQVEFKLTSEIDRLSKEIDRMKAELEKYLRELTQKQLIIKIERQKIDQQVKQIRQFEVKDKVREEQMNTPHHDKPSREDENTSTPTTHFEDPMSRSNLRYDNYFNAKEYDRLSKEYSDFKKHASQKLEALQSNLQEVLKDKAKLKAQLSIAYTREKQPVAKSQISKQKLEELASSLKSQIQKSGRLQQRLNALNAQNQNLAAELQKSNQKQSEQAGLLQTMRKEKKETSDRLSQQHLEKEKLRLSNFKQTELLQKIRKLQAQASELEELNKNLKSSYAKLQTEMQKETKNMFNHYEAQMKRIIAETGSTNSRLSTEVDLLKKQLQIQQSPSKLQKQKEETFNELKRSIQMLLAQKNKLLSQNGKLQSDKNTSDRQRIQSIQQLTALRQKVSSQSILIIALQEKNKSPLDSESRRKVDQLTSQLNHLAKQRDMIRGQHDSMRKHLQEQTKRAIYLQSQLAKVKTEDQKGRNVNVDYLNAKIKALEEALQAVGDQLADSKQSNEIPVSHGTKMVKSQIIASSPQSSQMQRLLDLEQDWIKKQKVYLQELQAMSRQIYTLKQALKVGKSDRPIVTSLPQRGTPINNTYHQNAIFNQFELIKVEKVLQGKRRWENISFAESLSKWGVPSIVCQEIEDLRNLFLSTSQIIGTINQEQINLQQLIESLPSLQNLLQFILRILAFFSEVPLNSPEATKIRNELANISKKYTGGYLFTVLEEYTIHILQNNAIEEYKRQLRAKARELLQIKQKLDQLITQQLQHEQKISNRPQPILGRSLQPGQYHSSSYSSLSNSRNK